MKNNVRFVAPVFLLAATLAQAATHKAPPLPSLPAPVATPAPAATANKPVVVTGVASTDGTVIYDGAAGAKSGLTLSTWGGGTVEDSGEMGYGSGGHSVKVTTHSFYEGARVGFNTPVDLGERTSSRYLELQIRFTDTETDDDTTNAQVPASIFRPDGTSRSADFDPASGGFLRLAQYPGAYPGNRGGRGRGRGPGMPGYPGGRGPGMPGYPGRPGYGRQGAEAAAWAPPFSNARLVFTLANGAECDISRPVPTTTGDDQDPSDAWLPLSVPLSALKFPAGSENSPLAAVTIGGDGNGTFYIGQIRLISDTTPISVQPIASQDVAAGDDVTLQARATGGVTNLKYSWDFDSSDGITEDGTGATVTHSYAKGNKTYTATLTVSDVDGIKKPAKTTVSIKVED